MKTFTRIVSFVWLLLLAQGAWAHVLSGTVYGNGSPLANAGIVLTLAADGSSAGQTTTNASGSYSLTVGDGTYNMLVQPPSGASGFSDSRVYGVVVAGADVTQNVALVTGAGSLSGIVKFPDGTPLSGIYVTLYDQASGNSFGQVKTGADGAYSFSVAPGTYKFQLAGSDSDGMNFPNAPSYFRVDDLAQNTVVSGATTQDLVIPLVRLSGKTTDANGVPVAGVALSHDGDSFIGYRNGVNYYINSYADKRLSDANGNYALTLFDGFSYNFSAISPSGSALATTPFNNVSVSGDTTFDFALQPGTILSGTVKLPDGTPLSGVYVSLYDQASSNSVGQVKTGADGAYSFSVAPGTYKFGLAGSESDGMSFPNAPSYIHVLYLEQNTVVSGATTQDLVLPLVRLSGKTTDANGVPVAGVVLNRDDYVDYRSGVFYYINSYDDKRLSDANGNYALTLFDGFSYNFSAVPPSGSALAPTPFNNVNVSGDTTFDFTLQPETILSGIVKLPDGTPLSGVYVSLHDQASSNSVGQVKTGADGAYSFSVAPGTYKFQLVGYDWDGMSFPNAPSYFRVVYLAQNTVVSGATTQDLVIPLVRLSGKTTDANGVPVAGVALNRDDYIDYRSGYYYINSYDDKRLSDANGNYALTLFDGFSYNFILMPPSGSGFVTSALNGLAVNGPTLLNVIGQLPDVVPPSIISGPTVTNLSANSATVQWQTNEPTTGGADWGTGTASETGYATQHSLAMTGLTPETTYTVTVSATDWAGSGPVTGTATFTTTRDSDTTAPAIVAGPTVSELTYDSAVIAWETNESATTAIDGDLTATVAGHRTQHRVELTGLAARTLYRLTVVSTDLAGNGPTSAAVQFTTLDTPDLRAPVITKGPWMLDVGAESATVAWETDEAASSGVSWNDGTAYGVYTDETLTRQHQVAITGLVTDTLYEVTVSSTDGLGNGPTLSNPFTFRTLDLSDTTPPAFIEAPNACALSDTLIGLCLRINEPASLTVEYGTAPDALTRTAARVQLDERHYLALTGLTPSTPYYLRAKVRDQAGNEATSALVQATTLASPAGAPVFLWGPTATYLGNDRVVIAWQTDRPAAALIEYEQGGETLRMDDGRLLTSHNLVVTNLAAGASYSFRVTVTGADGQQVVTLVTASGADLSPPVITSGPTAGSLPGGLTEIAWTTDEAADSRVNFGDAPGLLNRVAGDIDYSLNHSVKLSALVPGQTYYYQVTTVDPVGNTTVSAVGDFVAEVPSFTLRVQKAGLGSGTVGGGGVFLLDTLVSPSAAAAAGSTLTGWTPAGCAAPFALTADITCIATFDLAQAAGDLDGDGDLDASDYAVFRGALGACTGAARYRTAADYDGDGCVTTKDYRIWYGHYRAYLASR